jgi:hypothetical protein
MLVIVTRRFGWVALFAMMICRPAEAPATIAEQRARLPPAAECAHPVEGKWKGKTYYQQHRNWYEFDLEIRRVDGSDSELTGTIRVHFWDGVPEQTEPGDCMGQRIKIVQPASGSFVDGKITFGGTSWSVEEEICGHSGGYIVDTFSGTFEPDRQEFQSKNDWVDAGVHYSEPTVFRRVGCFDEAGPVHRSPGTKSPAFYPKQTKPPTKKSSGGC